MKIPQLATGKFPIPRLNWLLFAFFLRQNHALHWKIAIHSNYSKSWYFETLLPISYVEFERVGSSMKDVFSKPVHRITLKHHPQHTYAANDKKHIYDIYIQISICTIAVKILSATLSWFAPTIPQNHPTFKAQRLFPGCWEWPSFSCPYPNSNTECDLSSCRVIPNSHIRYHTSNQIFFLEELRETMFVVIGKWHGTLSASGRTCDDQW